jgi:hypothetical protein
MSTGAWTRLLFILCLSGAITACGPGPGDGGSARSGAPAQISEELNYKDFGTYVLHYNAISTDQIAPVIAKSYGITRSPNRAMINISILRKNEGATGTAVNAAVTAKVVNLTGQLKSVDMRPITEGEAIYYIGELNVANAETLIFDISVVPEGESGVLSVRYKKQFFDH